MGRVPEGILVYNDELLGDGVFVRREGAEVRLGFKTWFPRVCFRDVFL